MHYRRKAVFYSFPAVLSIVSKKQTQLLLTRLKQSFGSPFLFVLPCISLAIWGCFLYNYFGYL